MDYLSIANRDIFVTEDGSYTTRYVYDAGGKRISAEFDYAEGTHRGEAGENLQSDIAVSIGKVFYRTSILGSTLFAVDKDGKVIAHAIYDPWGKPLTETYTDANYSGLENINNYTGYTYDLTLALYFAQNRFYDADTHRFTQEDAAKGSTNWYVYCSNNPTVYYDWVGLKYKYIVLDKYLIEPTDKTYSSFGYVSLKEIISILNKYNVLSPSYKYNDSTTILTINSSKQKPMEYREIRIKLQRGAGIGEAISNYATSYFYIICCGDSKQDNIYVDLFSFTSAIGLSSRVQWCVTSLEDKITENDIKKGVRVKIFNGKQYLNVTKPIESAVKADTFKDSPDDKEAIRKGMDWYYKERNYD